MKATYIPPEDNSKNPLEQFTINLTQLAKDGRLDPIIGRDREIRRLIQILSRRTKNNPVLLGDPGVGKTAIIEGLAQRIVSGDVPQSLNNKELLSLDLSQLVAGASYRGQFEERLKGVLKEIEKGQGKYIMFIDELHLIAGMGKAEGSVDAGNMLKPALARGTLRAIGATTVSEYRFYIEKDPALERRFQPIMVEEPTADDTLAILRGIKEKYETHHGIKISDDALIAAVSMSVRYIHDRFLPDKAIDLIDEAAASAKIELDSLPSSLDEIKRKIIQLDIELAALKKEKNVEQRKTQLQEQKKQLQKNFDDLHKKWTEQKNIIQQLQKQMLSADRLKAELEIAEREVNLEKAAELKYSQIPSSQKKLQELEQKWKSIPKEDRILQESVSEDDIAQVVSRWTSIPATKLLAAESEKLAHLEDDLKKRVVGQDHALHQVAGAIRRSRTGLSEQNRPIGVFLFLGPTGVGKTETAKALSEILFNDEKALIRIDMSEYQESHTVARLTGAPPGYVGYEQGGQLTEAVRRRPYSVILFDEIEKAHPQVYNIFLQIFDDGRLTDGKGRTVSFQNTIIILTSNIASNIFSRHDNNKEEKIAQKIREFFKPEFLNRIDSIVSYNPLTKKTMEKITELRIEDVKQRLSEQGYSIKFTDKLRKHLYEVGFDPVFGARPLKRTLNELVVDEVALMIIEGKIAQKDRLVADYINNSVVVKKEIVN